MQHQFGGYFVLATCPMKFKKLNFMGHVAGTCRCNESLKRVPATFSCVCTCCDFVPATCPRHTTLTHVASVCMTHLFVAATWLCNMAPRVCPTWRGAGMSFNLKQNDYLPYPAGSSTTASILKHNAFRQITCFT